MGIERNIRPIEQESPLLLPTVDEDRWAALFDYCGVDQPGVLALHPWENEVGELLGVRLTADGVRLPGGEPFWACGKPIDEDGYDTYISVDVTALIASSIGSLTADDVSRLWETVAERFPDALHRRSAIDRHAVEQKAMETIELFRTAAAKGLGVVSQFTV